MYCVHCFPGHSPVIPWHSSSSALLPLAISKATAGGVWAHHLKVLSKPCVSSQKHFCFLLNRISSFLASSAISADSRDSWRDIYTLTSGWHMPEGQWTGQVGDPKQNTKYCHTQKSRPRPSATGVHMYIYTYIYTHTRLTCVRRALGLLSVYYGTCLFGGSCFELATGNANWNLVLLYSTAHLKMHGSWTPTPKTEKGTPSFSSCTEAPPKPQQPVGICRRLER